jgi:hypothetical protein
MIVVLNTKKQKSWPNSIGKWWDTMTIQEIYKDLLNNSSFTPLPGKTREESAWETAYKKVRQSDNNNKALELAMDVEKQMSLIPPRPGLIFDRASRRWTRPKYPPTSDRKPWQCPECKRIGRGKKFESMEELGEHKKGVHGIKLNEYGPWTKKFMDWVKHRGKTPTR